MRQHHSFSFMRVARRLLGVLLLLILLPVLTIGMAVALPVALLVGGLDAAESLLRVARRQLHWHRQHR